MLFTNNNQVVSQESYTSSSNVVPLVERRVGERRKAQGSNWQGNAWLTDAGVAETLALPPREQYQRLVALIPQYLGHVLSPSERVVLEFTLSFLMFVNGATSGVIRWEQVRDGHRESKDRK